MSRPSCILIVALLVVAAGTASAESVLLKNGRVMRGKILSETPKTVVIQVAGLGKMAIERCRIEKIVRDGALVPRPSARRTSPSPRSTPTGPAPTAAIPMGVAGDVLATYQQGLPANGTLSAAYLLSFVSKLELLGRRGTGDLAKLLGEAKDWRMRLLAARVLRIVGDPGATASLVHALGDTHYGALVPDVPGKAPRTRGGFAIRLEATAALRAIGLPAYKGLLATAEDRAHPDQITAIKGLAMVDVPGRAPLLMRLARDKSLRREIRSLSVAGLAKQGSTAAKALAELLSDRTVRMPAEQALRTSRDPAAIPTLMGYVRKTESNYDLAKRSARLISSIQPTHRPTKLEDAVDYMLLSYQLDRIGSRLGAPALSRLRYWTASKCKDMATVAGRALAGFSTKTPRPTPTSRPRSRPTRRPSGGG